MALKVLPPDTPVHAETRSFLVEEFKPVAARVASGDLTLISIGSRCVTSGALETFGLRSDAYPFDWLFSSLPMVEHCLRDDFAEFLNPDQYESVPIEDRAKPTIHRAHHRLYRDEFGVEHVFNHHEMPENIDHFERAVDRFRVAPNPHFLHISRQSGPEIVKQVKAVAKAAQGKVIAVCVRPTAKTGTPPGVSETASGTDYVVYDMTSEAPLGALGFTTANDERAFGEILLSHFS